MLGNRRAVLITSTIIVIGIILIGTGVFLFVLNPSGEGTNNTTTTSQTTTDNTTTYPTSTSVHNPYEVAIVLTVGGLGDMSHNDGAFTGATEAHRIHNINFTYVEPTQLQDYEQYHRAFAAHAEYIEPYDLIIGVGFDQIEAIVEVGMDYPNQNFAIITPDMWGIAIDPMVLPNIATVNFRENEGAALIGALAGLMTETGNVGFLGGMDDYFINRYAAGYFWGLSFVNETYTSPSKNITYSAQYTDDWYNITLGQRLTSEMYSAGIDIIFTAAKRSGLGAFEAAKTDNVTYPYPLWVIGADYPQMRFGCVDPEHPEPPTVGLTSMIKRIDIVVYDLMYEAVFGIWEGKVIEYGLEEGGLEYEINTDLLTLPQTVIDVIEEIKTEIINGVYFIPDLIY